MDEQVMRLSLRRQEVTVILVDGQQERRWKLRELNGTERNQYLDKMSSRFKIGKDGKAVGIKNFDGFQADLLRASLLDEKGEPVSAEVIEALPSSTQQELFKRAQRLSGLDTEAQESKGEDEDEEKNG